MGFFSQVRQQLFRVGKGIDNILSFILGSLLFFIIIMPMSFTLKIYRAISPSKPNESENVNSFWIESLKTKNIDSLKKRY
jgi:hypothetical protein